MLDKPKLGVGISTIAKKRNFNQWKNTTAVINWFKSIENKQHSSFICFDIEEFYPSISQDLLNKALDFASDYDNITTDERNYNPRKKLHLNPQAPTLAKERQSNIRRNNGKLRRRRNMWTRRKLTPHLETQRTSRKICRIFNNYGLRITIEANKQIINFLGVTCMPARRKLPATISNLPSHRYTQRQQHDRNVHRTHRERLQKKMQKPHRIIPPR